MTQFSYEAPSESAELFMLMAEVPDMMSPAEGIIAGSSTSGFAIWGLNSIQPHLRNVLEIYANYCFIPAAESTILAFGMNCLFKAFSKIKNHHTLPK